MLEEIGYEYAVIKMDLSKGDQFKEDFNDVIENDLNNFCKVRYDEVKKLMKENANNEINIHK